ncbi:MAG TPA: macro domain-containing protein [Candidatus Tumulicola sp.]
MNTVNCVGIMGRGIALQFKNAFPQNFKMYKAACNREEIQPGKVFVFETGSMTDPKYIINFPTKRHWRGRSRLSDIASGLTSLVFEIKQRKINSIAIPPLGSGLGGLYWPDVRILIEDAMRPLIGVHVTIYEPSEAPDARVMARTQEVPKMSLGRGALVVLIDRYLAGLLDPFISLLEVHKLMYFMQEAGQSLRLRYTKAPYGPYAENLRHVLHAAEGHLIAGYFDGGDAPDKRLELVPGAVPEAMQLLDGDAASKERFARVADLVAGFESPFGLELLSTVHWVATREGATRLADVVARVYEWSERKKNFSLRQIKLAFDVLHSKGWLPFEPAVTDAAVGTSSQSDASRST